MTSKSSLTSYLVYGGSGGYGVKMVNSEEPGLIEEQLVNSGVPVDLGVAIVNGSLRWYGISITELLGFAIIILTTTFACFKFYMDRKTYKLNLKRYNESKEPKNCPSCGEEIP